MSLQVKLVSATIRINEDPFSKNVKINQKRTPMLFSNLATKKKNQR